MKFSRIYLCLILFVVSCSPVEEPRQGLERGISSKEAKAEDRSFKKTAVESKSVQWQSNALGSTGNFNVGAAQNSPEAPQR
ncbi:hypothetical protein OAK35_03865, partial [Crocinitomicaceae bacterium]|nr:hypothetical protein [Crocinitomicaceae bacterium]